MVGQDQARMGKVRHGWRGVERTGTVRCGRAGMAWRDQVWPVAVRYGWLGEEWSLGVSRGQEGQA